MATAANTGAPGTGPNQAHGSPGMAPARPAAGVQPQQQQQQQQQQQHGAPPRRTSSEVENRIAVLEHNLKLLYSCHLKTKRDLEESQEIIGRMTQMGQTMAAGAGAYPGSAAGGVAPPGGLFSNTASGTGGESFLSSGPAFPGMGQHHHHQAGDSADNSHQGPFDERQDDGWSMLDPNIDGEASVYAGLGGPVGAGLHHTPGAVPLDADRLAALRAAEGAAADHNNFASVLEAAVRKAADMEAKYQESQEQAQALRDRLTQNLSRLDELQEQLDLSSAACDTLRKAREDGQRALEQATAEAAIGMEQLRAQLAAAQAELEAEVARAADLSTKLAATAREQNDLLEQVDTLRAALQKTAGQLEAAQAELVTNKASLLEAETATVAANRRATMAAADRRAAFDLAASVSASLARLAETLSSPNGGGISFSIPAGWTDAQQQLTLVVEHLKQRALASGDGPGVDPGPGPAATHEEDASARTPGAESTGDLALTRDMVTRCMGHLLELGLGLVSARDQAVAEQASKLQEAEAALETARRQLADLSDELSTHEMAALEAGAQAGEAGQALAAASASLEKLTRELEATHEHLTSALEKIDHLTAQQAAAEADAEAARAEARASDEAARGAAADAAACRAKEARARDELARAEAALSRAEAQTKKALAEADKLRTKAQHAEASAKAAQEQLAAAQDQARQARLEACDAVNDATAAREEAAKATARAATIAEEAEADREEAGRLRAAAARADAEARAAVAEAAEATAEADKQRAAAEAAVAAATKHQAAAAKFKQEAEAARKAASLEQEATRVRVAELEAELAAARSQVQATRDSLETKHYSQMDLLKRQQQSHKEAMASLERNFAQREAALHAKHEKALEQEHALFAQQMADKEHQHQQEVHDLLRSYEAALNRPANPADAINMTDWALADGGDQDLPDPGPAAGGGPGAGSPTGESAPAGGDARPLSPPPPLSADEGAFADAQSGPGAGAAAVVPPAGGDGGGAPAPGAQQPPMDLHFPDFHNLRAMFMYDMTQPAEGQLATVNSLLEDGLESLRECLRQAADASGAGADAMASSLQQLSLQELEAHPAVDHILEHATPEQRLHLHNILTLLHAGLAFRDQSIFHLASLGEQQLHSALDRQPELLAQLQKRLRGSMVLNQPLLADAPPPQVGSQCMFIRVADPPNSANSEWRLMSIPSMQKKTRFILSDLSLRHITKNIFNLDGLPTVERARAATSSLIFIQCTIEHLTPGPSENEWIVDIDPLIAF